MVRTNAICNDLREENRLLWMIKSGSYIARTTNKDEQEDVPFFGLQFNVYSCRLGEDTRKNLTGTRV